MRTLERIRIDREEESLVKKNTTIFGVISLCLVLLVAMSVIVDKPGDNFFKEKGIRYDEVAQVEEISSRIPKAAKVLVGDITKDDETGLEYDVKKTYKGNTAKEIVEELLKMEEIPPKTNIAGIGPNTAIELLDEDGNSLIVFTYASGSSMIDVEKIEGKEGHKGFFLSDSDRFMKAIGLESLEL